MPKLMIHFSDAEKELLSRAAMELGTTVEDFVHDSVFPKKPEDATMKPSGEYPEKEERIYVD